LKFVKYVINIKKFLFQKFDGTKRIFQSLGGYQRSEKHFATTHVLNIFFLVNLLALKFGTRVINVKMILWQNFHGKIPILELSRSFQSGQH